MMIERVSYRFAVLVSYVFGLLCFPVLGEDQIATSTGIVVGEVSAVSVDGVRIKLSRDGDRVRERLIPWFEMRLDESSWQVPAEFETVSDVSIRAHARRGRGDISGAAELYADVASEMVGGNRETIRKVFGTLLEDAVNRNDWLDAVVAARILEGSGFKAFDGFDDRYGISQLAPMLRSVGRRHRLNVFARELLIQGVHSDPIMHAILIVHQEDPRVSEVLDVYEQLIELRRTQAGSRLGVELYTQMFVAQVHPDAEERREAREWLASRVTSRNGTWQEAWCRLAVGASLFKESGLSWGENAAAVELVDQESISRGVIQCVYVMIDDTEELSVFADLAMEIAVRALIASDRVEEAVRLMRDDQITFEK